MTLKFILPIPVLEQYAPTLSLSCIIILFCPGARRISSETYRLTYPEAIAKTMAFP
jgi:hypothetical protein